VNSVGHSARFVAKNRPAQVGGGFFATGARPEPIPKLVAVRAGGNDWVAFATVFIFHATSGCTGPTDNMRAHPEFT
jgi:hypothetical protein